MFIDQFPSIEPLLSHGGSDIQLQATSAYSSKSIGNASRAIGVHPFAIADIVLGPLGNPIPRTHTIMNSPRYNKLRATCMKQNRVPGEKSLIFVRFREVRQKNASRRKGRVVNSGWKTRPNFRPLRVPPQILRKLRRETGGVV